MGKTFSNNMKFKGIFFDFYGTLVIYNDNTKAWADWISTFYNCLQNYGLGLSEESFEYFNILWIHRGGLPID